MSRFSIRTQVFAFAGAFLALMVCSAIISLVTNTRVGGLVQKTSHAAEIDASVAGAFSSAEFALLSILMIDRGEPTAFDDLDMSLADAVSGLDKALSVMAEHQSDYAIYNKAVEPLTATKSDLAGLHQEVPNIREALGHERSRDFRNRVIPLLQASLETLEAEHILLMENAQRSNTLMLDIVDTSSVIVVGALVVSIVAGFGLALLFGRKLANPIQRSVVAVGQIADKKYDTDVPDIERKDELGEIARQLDVLRVKLSKGDAASKRVKSENDRRAELFEALGSAMSNLKDGDLEDRIASDDWGDLGEGYVNLCEDFNGLATTLEELVGSLRNSAKTVEDNSRELSNMSNEMSRRAELQAATLEESAAALDELSESVQCAASRAQEADEKVVEGRRRAQEGGEVMTQAMEAMSSIAKSSEQITQIIGVIDDIAFQTNLLALNAGVEAARAGESGKGFAVVASEVRGLAQRSAESASEIKDLVLNSTAQVEDGEKLVQQTSVTLGQIVESVTGVSEMVAGIAISAREQAGAVKEINVGVAELDKVTQQNAAMVGDATTSSQELSHEASRLTDLLESFAGENKINETPAVSSPEPFAPHSGGSEADSTVLVSDQAGVPDEPELYDQDLEVGAMPLDSTLEIVDEPNTSWEEQPVHTALVDAELDTWAPQDQGVTEPEPMEPHQPVASNADQWKEF